MIQRVEPAAAHRIRGSRVVLELVSHDAGGVTEADLDLAKAIQALT